jgi:hypothetical protein
MRKLRDAGIACGGLTMCWTYPYEKNDVLGRAVSEAMARVYGPGDAMLFNDLNTKPRVVHRAADGHVVTTTPTNVDDLPSAGASPEATEEQIAAAVDSFISADGKSGKYVEAMERDGHLIILTHVQTIYSAGTEKGFTVLTRAVERLNKTHGKRIRWMTGLEIAKHFAGR